MSTVCITSPNISKPEKLKLSHIVSQHKSLCLIKASDICDMQNSPFMEFDHLRSFNDPILDMDHRPEENSREKYTRCMTVILKYKTFCIAGLTVVMAKPKICHLISENLIGSSNLTHNPGRTFLKIYDINPISFPTAKEII